MSLCRSLKNTCRAINTLLNRRGRRPGRVKLMVIPPIRGNVMGLLERFLSHDRKKGIPFATEQPHHAFGSCVFSNDLGLGPTLCHQHL